MNKCFAIPFVLGMLCLTGCGEDTPSDKLSSEVIRPIAESGIKGVEISDFNRDNGWVDTQAPNRYVIQYKYNFKLTQPLPEVVLGLAKGVKAEFDEKQKNPGFMGIDAMQASLESSLAASQWINAQGSNFKARRDSFLGNCAACVEYWNREGAKDESKSRRDAFVLAWAHLESLGFTDSAAVGDKVPRQAWAAFTKTEKGWVAAQ
jgi:hypothetical protein